MVLKYKGLRKKKIDTLEFCNQISETFKELSKTLNLSNSDFIRTTEIRHKKSVQFLWNELKKMMKFIYRNTLMVFSIR